MGCIYCIRNIINGKEYVGKTAKSDIWERFKEHLNDYSRRDFEKRPLYDAMKKYGVDNFKVRLLETCSNNILDDREIYWIDALNTYHNGYNATKGGEGKLLIDRAKVIETYQRLGLVNKTAEELSISKDSVSDILKEANIEVPSHRDESKVNAPKRVRMYDLEGNFLQEFDSVSLAGKWLLSNGYIKVYGSGVRGHIGNCANGKAHNAYKHIWKYIE